ncbi:MAG TPA: MSMEG_4193 family putative phosphomutase [Caldilineaceae bacterium]|nr:MSMEG_4193 family putative phosphomutase [Caldilineaceae bacterium]
MKSSTTYLLLIRHGENEWVKSRRLAGRTPGVHLNERGQEQAAGLVKQLANQPISAIYSSPLERCLQTAEPVAAALGLPVISEPGVMEVDYGEWQGGDLKELAKTPEWQLVQHHPSSFCFPGGETLHHVQARAVWTLERIRQAHPNQLVAVFSHGDVIRTALAHYLGVPIDLFQRIAVATASISALAFYDSRPMVLFMNYLAELPTFEWKQEEETGEETPGEPKSAAQIAAEQPTAAPAAARAAG